LSYCSATAPAPAEHRVFDRMPSGPAAYRPQRQANHPRKLFPTRLNALAGQTPTRHPSPSQFAVSARDTYLPQAHAFEAKTQAHYFASHPLVAPLMHPIVLLNAPLIALLGVTLVALAA